MMVAAAIVAMILGVHIQLARWRQLARLYEIRAGRTDRIVATVWRRYAAMSHEQWLADCRAVDEVNRKGGVGSGWTAHYGPEPAFARRMADYLNRLAKKYHRAAAQPWWPVEPDPPPPKPYPVKYERGLSDRVN
jgi:hypothetical protein